MRQIEHTSEFKVGQQIAWVYAPGDGDVGPLAGRVESIQDGQIRIDRGNTSSVFFEGDYFSHENGGVVVYVLEEAPEHSYTVPGEALMALDSALSKPRDMKGYKAGVIKAAEVVAIHAKRNEPKP